MAFDKTKCDPKLGEEIRNHLISLGIETPTIEKTLNVDNKTKIDVIQKNMVNVLNTLGLDLEDDSLIETANRVAKMLVLETMWGLKSENFPKCTTVENKMQYDEMVVERGVNVMSICEHHLVTIDGIATVAYIPNNKVLGLSKINRIVEYFSKRPQIQERLTEQVYHALSHILETDNVAVMIDAVHYCVRARGVEDTGSRTVTSKLGGVFKDSSSNARSEFLAIANQSVVKL